METVNWKELSYDDIIESSNNQTYEDILSIHLLLQESIRHYFSRMLSAHNHDANNPMHLDLIISTHEDMGLSELEKPCLKCMYQESDGTIWLLFEGVGGYENIDEFDIEFLIEIIQNIEIEEGHYENEKEKL